jgi:hypothetical protein
MEPLEKDFVWRGMHYIQKKRTEKTAMYDQYLILTERAPDGVHKTGKSKGKTKYIEVPVGEEWVAYEVFHVRKQEEHIGFGGALYKAKELFPRDERFGVDAYCCKELKRAEVKFKELEERFANSSDEEIVEDEVEEEEFTAE